MEQNRGVFVELAEQGYLMNTTANVTRSQVPDLPASNGEQHCTASIQNGSRCGNYTQPYEWWPSQWKDAVRLVRPVGRPTALLELDNHTARAVKKCMKATRDLFVALRGSLSG